MCSTDGVLPPVISHFSLTTRLLHRTARERAAPTTRRNDETGSCKNKAAWKIFFAARKKFFAARRFFSAARRFHEIPPHDRSPPRGDCHCKTGKCPTHPLPQTATGKAQAAPSTAFYAPSHEKTNRPPKVRILRHRAPQIARPALVREQKKRYFCRK